MIFIIVIFFVVLDRFCHCQRKYLFISPEKITYLKQQVENDIEPFKDFFAGVTFTATRYDVPTVGEWIAFSEVQYRPWGELLPDVCLAYLLTEDPAHLSFAHDLMDAMSTSYPDWSVNLGISHVLAGFAICYDWLYDTFTSQQKQDYITSLITFGGQLFEKVEGQSGPDANNRYFNLLHNIIHVNAAAVAIAGYSLLDEPDLPDPNVPKEWLTLIEGFYSLVLEHIQRDGTSQEGIMYYSYELWAQLAYFALEKQFNGTDRLANNVHFQKTGNFRIHVSAPGYDENVMLGDTSPSSEWGPDYFLFRLASVFKDSSLQWLGKKMIERKRITRGYYNCNWKSMIWYDETVDAEEITNDNTPNFFYFEDSEMFFSRESWEDANSAYLTFKSGPACGHWFESLRYPNNIGICGAGHGHCDNGAINLYLNGEVLLKDDGYISKNPTQHHNCVSFGEERRSQYGDPAFQGETFGGWLYRDYKAEKAYANICHTEFNDDFEYLVTNLTRMYPLELNLVKYLRHLVFLKKKYVIMYDEVEFSTNHSAKTVNLHFHSHVDGNQSIVFSKQGEYYEYRREKSGFVLLELDPDNLHQRNFGHFYEEEFESLTYNSTTKTNESQSTFMNLIIPFNLNDTTPYIKGYKKKSDYYFRVDFSEKLKVNFDFASREVSFVKYKNESNNLVATVLGIIFGSLFAFVFIAVTVLLVLIVIFCSKKKTVTERPLDNK